MKKERKKKQFPFSSSNISSCIENFCVELQRTIGGVCEKDGLYAESKLPKNTKGLSHSTHFRSPYVSQLFHSFTINQKPAHTEHDCNST